MKFWEALKALTEGKKVRKPNWEYSHYLVNRLDGSAINNLGYYYKYSDLDFTLDWELYEEPKKTKEVYQWRYYVGSYNKWFIDDELLTISEAKNKFGILYSGHQKHQGPFEV